MRNRDELIAELLDLRDGQDDYLGQLLEEVVNVMKNTTCPRCLGGIPNNDQPGQYPGALSRTDNKTEVCSACGEDEALEDLLGPKAITSQKDWPIRS